jgi:uncharacterized MAPEG superfamily protein
MTPELLVLTLAALLQFVQFVAYSVPANRQVGPKYAAGPRDEPRHARPAPRAAATRADQPFRRADPVHHRRRGDHPHRSVHRPHRRLRMGPIWPRASSMSPPMPTAWNPWRSVIWAFGFIATLVMLIAALI